LDIDKKTLRKKRKIAHYRFLEALYMSFFSPRLYIDVVRRWRGLGLLYLLLMLSIFVLPYAVHIMMEYQQVCEKALIEPVKKLPPFSVRKGVVYFYGAMPYLVKNSEGEVISLIDTTGKISRLPYFLYPKATILVTKRAMHLNLNFPTLNFLKSMDTPATKEEVFHFGANENVDIVGEGWVHDSHINQLSNMMSFLIYPSIVMLYFGIYAVVLLSFALFGRFVARFVFKVHFTFQEAFRLLIVAATPQALIYFVLFAQNRVYPGTGILYIILLTVYFSFGTVAYRRDNRAMVLQ